jgi:NAD(P)-dependent dehydrogenase (short-subunit alcohol dehydrogenase family)
MFMKTIAIEYQRKSPQTIVTTLHPGTTDTQLSQPFQKNVPPEKLFSTEKTVDQLLKVIEKLDISESGNLYSWDGSRLPW